MAGKRINGIEYIHLFNCNDFKKNSLYDNLYLTLKEIFWNANIKGNAEYFDIYV